MNVGLMGLERYEGGVINDRIFSLGWTIPLKIILQLKLQILSSFTCMNTDQHAYIELIKYGQPKLKSN